MKKWTPKVYESFLARLKAEKDGFVSHLRRDSREAIFFRIVLLATFTILCGATASDKLEKVQCEYDPEDPRCASSTVLIASVPPMLQGAGTALGVLELESGKGQPATEEKDKPDWAPEETKAAYKNTADALIKQSEQLQSWGVLILTGIIAILITTKVHRTPGAQWSYVALGPAAIFLVIALNTGVITARRYTFLLSVDDFSEFPSLSSLVQLQSELFANAIICVSLFAGWFLLLIAMGKVQTFEPPKER